MLVEDSVSLVEETFADGCGSAGGIEVSMEDVELELY